MSFINFKRSFLRNLFDFCDHSVAMPPLMMGLDGQYETRGERETRRRSRRRQRELEEREAGDEAAARRPKSALPGLAPEKKKKVRQKAPVDFSRDFQIHPELLESTQVPELKSMPVIKPGTCTCSCHNFDRFRLSGLIPSLIKAILFLFHDHLCMIHVLLNFTFQFVFKVV